MSYISDTMEMVHLEIVNMILLFLDMFTKKVKVCQQ